MKKIIAMLTVGFLLMGTVLTGCGSGASNVSEKGSESGATESQDAEAIKLAVYPLPSPYFEFAMDELGMFEKYGADVELVYFAQYSDVIQALNTGNVDGAIMGITETVSPIVNDLGLSIIAMTDYSYGMDGIVVAEGIDSMADLKGETIATNIGTMNHMLLLNALEEAGLSAEDVTITNMSEGDATAAFVGGSIKAASIFDPQMTTAAEEGNGKIIYSSKDMKGELADVLLMKDTVLAERSEEVQGIVNAWFATQKMFEEDNSAVTPAIAKGADMTEEEFLDLLNGLEFATVEYNQEVFADNGKAMIDLVTKVANFLYETECVDSVPDTEAISKAINSTFIENVNTGE